jgi:hypothetical protein
MSMSGYYKVYQEYVKGTFKPDKERGYKTFLKLTKQIRKRSGFIGDIT